MPTHADLTEARVAQLLDVVETSETGLVTREDVKRLAIDANAVPYLMAILEELGIVERRAFKTRTGRGVHWLLVDGQRLAELRTRRLKREPQRPRRSPTRRRRPRRDVQRPSKDDLQRLYVEEQKSTRTIGDELGVSYATVSAWMKAYGIKPRKPGFQRGSANVRHRGS